MKKIHELESRWLKLSTRRERVDKYEMGVKRYAEQKDNILS